MTLEEAISTIRTIPDFPKPGIMFKDITTAIKNAEVLHFLVEELYQYYKDKGITKVVGLESRGFVVGSILAYRLGAGFVLVRKSGKLPAETYKVTYDLEYGTDSLEIHKDAIEPNDVVLLHDDLLATGGTAEAAVKLLEKFDTKDILISFLIELTFLNGHQKLENIADVHSLIKF